jgi:hypothetical protein
MDSGRIQEGVKECKRDEAKGFDDLHVLLYTFEAVHCCHARCMHMESVHVLRVLWSTGYLVLCLCRINDTLFNIDCILLLLVALTCHGYVTSSFARALYSVSLASTYLSDGDMPLSIPRCMAVAQPILGAPLSRQ